MNEPSTNRALSPDERALLARLLHGAAFPGAPELADQIEEVRVTGGIPTLLDLQVPTTATPSPVEDGPVPGRAFVDGPSGEVEGEVIVWVKGGYLAGLEYAWYTDEAPTSMPTPDRLRVE